MSKKDRFRFDPLSEEFSVVDSLDFIGTNIFEKPAHLPDSVDSYSDEKKEKKIYSYYLEIDLAKRLKRLARLSENTYSGLVNQAIRDYVEEYGY